MKKKMKMNKEVTDEETFNNIKMLYEQNNEAVMDPDKWKKLRMIELGRKGKRWSK